MDTPPVLKRDENDLKVLYYGSHLNKSVKLAVECDRYVYIGNGVVLAFDGGDECHLLRFDPKDNNILKTVQRAVITKIKKK